MCIRFLFGDREVRGWENEQKTHILLDSDADLFLDTDCSSVGFASSFFEGWWGGLRHTNVLSQFTTAVNEWLRHRSVILWVGEEESKNQN